MKTFAAFVLVIGLLVGASGFRRGTSSWQRADVYLVDWYSESLTARGVDTVRTYADHKHSYRGDISQVVRALALDQLRPTEESRSMSANLVVDFFTESGVRTTYFATDFHLYSPADSTEHPIDKAFQNRFTQLAQ